LESPTGQAGVSQLVFYSVGVFLECQMDFFFSHWTQTKVEPVRSNNQKSSLTLGAGLNKLLYHSYLMITWTYYIKLYVTDVSQKATNIQNVGNLRSLNNLGIKLRLKCEILPTLLKFKDNPFEIYFLLSFLYEKFLCQILPFQSLSQKITQTGQGQLQKCFSYNLGLI
jgi:hypothetical protein